MGKSYNEIYCFLPNVSFITGIILITIIRFARYHLLLASNSTSMTGSMYLSTIQICRSLNERYHYLTLTTSMIPVAKYTSISHQARTLKAILLGLI